MLEANGASEWEKDEEIESLLRCVCGTGVSVENDCCVHEQFGTCHGFEANI